MKERNRKRFDSSLKARVALEAAQDKESLAQLARHHGVHPVVVGPWKKLFVERAAAAFERGATRDVEQREAELLKNIGELTVERDVLSRGLPRSC